MKIFLKAILWEIYISGSSDVLYGLSHMKMIFNCLLPDVECGALSWSGSYGHFNRVIILYHNNADIVNIVNIVPQY